MKVKIWLDGHDEFDVEMDTLPPRGAHVDMYVKGADGAQSYTVESVEWELHVGGGPGTMHPVINLKSRS